MAKIIFLISIMFLSSYLTEQANLSPPNNIIDEITDKLNKFVTKTLKVSDDNISKEFEVRNLCKTIGEVHNQVNPYMDSAYATTGTLADRMCIATNRSYNQLWSTEELISCSGQNYSNFVPEYRAWEYFKLHGVVSEGKYNTNNGCQPFQLPPVSELLKYYNKHRCIRYCYGNKSIEYNHDHVKVKKWYYIKGPNRVVSIQKEVQAHGPVVVYFLMYDNFFSYKSGVYAKTANSTVVRAQYAKLIGWGVEDGVDYWLLVNSNGDRMDFSKSRGAQMNVSSKV